VVPLAKAPPGVPISRVMLMGVGSFGLGLVGGLTLKMIMDARRRKHLLAIINEGPSGQQVFSSSGS